MKKIQFLVVSIISLIAQNISAQYWPDPPGHAENVAYWASGGQTAPTPAAYSPLNPMPSVGTAYFESAKASICYCDRCTGKKRPWCSRACLATFRMFTPHAYYSYTPGYYSYGGYYGAPEIATYSSVSFHGGWGTGWYGGATYSGGIHRCR